MNNIKFHYDEVADVLYASIDKSDDVFYTEPEDGIVIRLDRKSKTPVGFTIVHYMKRISEVGLFSIPYIGKVNLPKFNN